MYGKNGGKNECVGLASVGTRRLLLIAVPFLLLRSSTVQTRVAASYRKRQCSRETIPGRSNESSCRRLVATRPSVMPLLP